MRRGKRPVRLDPNTVVDVSPWMKALGWQPVEGDVYHKFIRCNGLLMAVATYNDDTFRTDMERCYAFEEQMHSQRHWQ